MSVSAHGAVIDVTATHLTLAYSQLAQSLGSPARVEIAIKDISAVDYTNPGPASFGTLELTRKDGQRIAVRFAPGSHPDSAAALIQAAQAGELKPGSGGGALSGAAISGLDFTALDVETANDSWGSICQVGLVRFRNGQEVDSFSCLTQPPKGLGEFLQANRNIHGISPEDVKDCPSFADILPKVLDFVGTDVVVAHNAQFDGTALRLAARASGCTVPEVTLACSLALAREASRAGVLHTSNHRLASVVQAVGGPEFKHHDAGQDARAAGVIIVELARLHGYQGDITNLFSQRGLCLGSVSAEKVMPVLRAATAPLSPTDLGAGTDFRDPKSASTPSKKKKADHPAPWSAVATPNTIPQPNPDADPQGPLFGQKVTLTGDFEPYDKAILWNAMAECGATVGKSVTKKTTVLVLGTWNTKTSKEKRAEELISQGQDIALWSKEQLFETLELETTPEPEPPF